MCKYEEHPVLDKNTVDVILEQAAGNHEIINEIFQSFVEDTDELTEDVKNHLENKAYGELRVSVHTIKGLCGTIGASQMHALTKDIDALIKDEQYDKASELTPLLFSTYKRLREKINTDVLK
jgi:HPt (histidine-containing phosphotransfer) domain-containing protein